MDTQRKFQDESLAPTPLGHAGMSKEIKFKWVRPSEPGEFRLVPKAILSIDESYQRGPVSKTKVIQIAREWSWVMFGCLTVGRRADGTLVVIVGGHRTRAAMHRSDIDLLPCMIFDIEEIGDEAAAFVGEAITTSAIASFYKHRAAVVAGDPVAILVDAMLEELGYAATHSSQSPNTIRGIRQLHELVARDADLARRVLALAVRIAAGEHLKATLVAALFEAAVSHPVILTAPHSDRLVRLGPDAIFAEMRRKEAIVGSGGARIWSLAILDLVNKGRRSHNRLGNGGPQ